MPGINDRLVVTFDPQVIEKIRDAIVQFRRLVRENHLRMSDTRDQVSLSIELNRPDTLDEGEIARYLASVDEFAESLRGIHQSVQVKTEIAEFHLV